MFAADYPPAGWLAAWTWKVREDFFAGRIDGDTAFMAYRELCDMQDTLYRPGGA
jgi:hypothetical protein